MTRTSFGFLFAVAMLGAAALDGKVLADDSSGAYLGGNFGRARDSYETSFIDNQIEGIAAAAGETVNFTARSIRKMSDAWWVNTGYFFTPYVGIDAAFFHLGEIKYFAVGKLAIAGTSQSISTTTEVTSHGPALSLIGRLPLTESFEADLRVGDYYGKAVVDNQVTVGSKGVFLSSSKSSSGLLAGVGGAYTFGGHWSIRLDYLRVSRTGDSHTVGKFSVNLATAGVSFTF
jgi:hypothetical protein